jgi:DNA-binding transcriptional LysR family regulator
MNLDALRHLALIVEHRTFTEAARHAHLSQPALTASIRKLEEELGARLLHRGPGGASVTAAGAALLPRARAAIAAIEEGRRAVEEVQGLRAGEVRVGGGATACTYFLPPVLAAFRRKHPGIRFLLREAITDEILDALARGELDLAVVNLGSDASGQRGEPWRRDELILVGAPGLEPRGAPFIVFTRGAVSRTLFDRHFPDEKIVMELGSIAGVKGNARAGIGLALVSRAAVADDLGSGRLVEVPDRRTPIHRDLALVHNGLERLPPAAAALRTLLLAGADPPRRRR